MWLTLILTALTTVDGPGFAVSAAVAPSETLSEAAAGCTSNFDCGGDNGNCDEDKGVCKCRKPWYGVECSSLALAPASKSNGYVRNLGRACLPPYSSRFRHSFLTLTPSPPFYYYLFLSFFLFFKDITLITLLAGADPSFRVTTASSTCGPRKW